MSDERARRRVQLHLADLVFAVLCVGGVVGVVFPLLVKEQFTVDPGLPYPSAAVTGVPAVVYGIMTFFVAGAVLCTLLLGSRNEWTRRRKWISAGVFAVGLCGVMSFFNGRGVIQLYRGRMAANETYAVGACKAYTLAQDAYRLNKGEYATDPSALISYGVYRYGNIDSALVGAFVEEGRTAVPWHGYLFKIHKGQSCEYFGGPRSYLEKGADGRERMTGGYALIATPAVYDFTGRNTFIVSHHGTINQKDIGVKAPEYFRRTTTYYIDSTWVVDE